MNYKESTVVGTSYVRCNRVQIVNKLNQTPWVVFGEEKVITTEDGSVTLPTSGTAECTKLFDPIGGSIALLDPETDTPTGETVSHAKLYQILYSLYLETAQERDTV